MPEYNNENRGALFSRPKRGEKGPDVGGDIELSYELLAYLVEQHRTKQPLKLELAGWKRTSKAGSGYLSLLVQKPFKKGEGQRSKAPAPAFDLGGGKPALPDDEIPF